VVVLLPAEGLVEDEYCRRDVVYRRMGVGMMPWGTLRSLLAAAILETCYMMIMMKIRNRESVGATER
jgi:hypothetical protein